MTESSFITDITSQSLYEIRQRCRVTQQYTVE